MRGPKGTPVGELRRVNISDLVVSDCDSRQATIISGIPGHSIEDLKLSNIYVLHRGGGTKQDQSIEPAELENVYPDPNRFGPMPAHGFFIRHVKGLDMHDVEIKSLKEDFRPGFVLQDVDGADFTRIKLAKSTNVPSIALNNVKNFSVTQSRPVPDTRLESVQQTVL